MAADLVDELCLTLAPLSGGDPLPIAIAPPGATAMARYRLGHVLQDDSSLFLRYERARRGGDPDGGR